MNIFYLHPNAKICAQYHCDKHVVKMILELTQLLYTACWIKNNLNFKQKIKQKIKQKTKEEPLWIQTAPKTKSGRRGYRATHNNHPCAIWTRESLGNYLWLCELALELCSEYTHRYHKIHACQQHIDWLKSNPPFLLSNNNFTEIRLAMPEKYKVVGDPVLSYQNYYLGEKSKFAQWTKREIPNWFITPPKLVFKK